MVIRNQRNLDNPRIQRMPTNQRDWTHYQNEIHRILAGSFTPTFVGFSSDPSSPTVFWSIDGSIITLRLAFTTGTSDTTTFQITNLPNFLSVPQAQIVLIGGFTDNSINTAEFGSAIIGTTDSGQLTFGLGGDNINGGGFTASGTKGFQSATGTHIIYSNAGSGNV